MVISKHDLSIISGGGNSLAGAAEMGLPAAGGRDEWADGSLLAYCIRSSGKYGIKEFLARKIVL